MNDLRAIGHDNRKGMHMRAIIKRTLIALLLVFVAASPMACLNINSPRDDRPKTDKTEVNVGGPHGVTVESGGK